MMTAAPAAAAIARARARPVNVIIVVGSGSENREEAARLDRDPGQRLPPRPFHYGPRLRLRLLMVRTRSHPPDRLVRVPEKWGLAPSLRGACPPFLGDSTASGSRRGRGPERSEWVPDLVERTGR